MKKITFMFIFLIYSVGFSQTNNSGNVPISDLGDNNPTYAQSEPRVSSNVETITISSLGGENNPTHAQSEPRVSSNVETIAISDLGDNNPTYAQSEPRVSSNVETIAISSLGGENNPTHAQSEPRVYSDARTIPIPGTSDYKQGFENLVSIPFIPNQNGAGSDDCTGATDVFAGETYVGNTGDYTDTGGNAAPDVWYAYSGAAGAVTLSLCDGATDYDSYLRVFDACGGTEIASNDDSCSLQSELEFTADGTSTYYIMVEGYGSGSGNYSLSVSVLSPSGGDTCDNAYPVVSGETYVGDTSTMTDTGSNPSPDAWYSYMGAAGDVTLSLCDGATDYDSYLRVFDACGGTEIASNDDSCSLQSEIVFAADAGATYYIMVEGYSSSSGNFSLAVSVEEEEEEEWGPCENGTTSNEFENGYGGTVCNDVVVAADDNLLLEEIMPSYFHDVGAVFESIDVRIFSADFGTLIYEQAGAPVISQEYQGENYGFDISKLSILIAPVDMPGTSGAETSYWVELSNAVTSGTAFFWELESTEVIGQPYYVGEAGAGGIVDDVTDGVFVWDGQCGEGGGGGDGPCENGTASNAFENGYSGPICNDVVVAADDNFLLEEIMPSYFHDIGAVFESIDVRIFSADFGTLIYEQAGAPVISQVYQGENYGFDISMLSILIDPVDMPGTSGAETSYWVELSNAVTSGASTFWELESTEVIGQPYYVGAAGAGGIIDDVTDGVFSWAGQCGDGGGGEGGPCENGTASNAFENGYSGPICNDVVVAADDNFLLEEIMPSYFHDIGAVFESIDVRIFSADFSTLIYEQAGAPVISQVYQGENYGFDISMLSILIDPVDMPGTSGAETSYWVELSNAVTSGASTFWELESTEVIGQPYYVGAAGAGGIIDDVTDGVFSWAGQCGPAEAVKVDLVKTGQLLMNSKMDIVVLFVTML